VFYDSYSPPVALSPTAVTYGRSRRYPTEINSLSDHLRAKRQDLRLTQKQVALAPKTDPMTINNLETNRTNPAVRLVPRIIEFLGYVPYSIPKSLPEQLRTRRISGNR